MSRLPGCSLAKCKSEHAISKAITTVALSSFAIISQLAHSDANPANFGPKHRSGA
jgi:hypothetical protein